MSLAGSQQKIFLRLLAMLRPHWHRDPNLPARIQGLFAANRAIGSRDRKLHRELLYTALRFLPWIEPLLDHDPSRAAQIVAWLAADLPATRAYRAATCGDWPPCPPTVAAKAAHLGANADDLLPAWVGRHCTEAVISPDLDVLHTRGPLWLRLQTSAASQVFDEFAANGWTWRRAEDLPAAIELLAEADVTKTNAWACGLIEVQDLGLQLIVESVGVVPGGRWLDACAGAGGKTLQLAALLGASGHVDAHDIRPAALRELEVRARRATRTDSRLDDIRLAAIAVHEVPPAGSYDGVLVDAPCSGSGTWRRSPHLKWTTGAGQVTRAAEKQFALLTQFAALVRPGGQLVYSTCSLSRFENEEVVAAFLTAHSDFAPEPPARDFGATRRRVGLAILPAQHNTDGFYFAMLRRR
jgi:16S rRNA (cytosine967-C5)-methyltransferase